MTINKLRTFIYFLGRILGDFNAIQRGKIAERLVRRASGRITGKFLSSITRAIFKK